MSQRDRLAAALHDTGGATMLEWADALLAHGVVALEPGERVVTVQGLGEALMATFSQPKWDAVYPCVFAMTPEFPRDVLAALDAGESFRYRPAVALPDARMVTVETLAKALLTGHIFEHPGDLSTCDTEDEPAARRYAAAILAALDAGEVG